MIFDVVKVDAGGADDRSVTAADESLISALRRAVETDSTPALRCHLASLLLATAPSEALVLAQSVLAVSPADIEALRVSVEAATRVGNQELAAGYRHLLDALGSSSPAPRPAPAPHAAVPAGPDPSHTEITDADELVELWSQVPAPPEPDIGRWSRPTVRLADVGGMAHVKQHLEMAFFGPLRNPELSMAFNKTVRGGLLLWGPPGCGKTYLGRAVAGELDASFYSIGIADVLDMWVGSSERNLHAIFQFARRNAPCVLFFDELDALGQKRSSLRTGGAALRGAVNQLLSELDGFDGNNGVYILGATNHPWDLDEALVRPGRFDRSLLVLPPDAEARMAIAKGHLAGRPVGDVRWKAIVKGTDGWSGADIAHLCETAVERAMAESITAGRLIPVDDRHLKASMAVTRSSLDAWFEVARNYATYSNADGRFDDLVAYLTSRR